MISNIGKTLFVCLFFVVITGCVFDDIGVIVPELVRTDYTFDEIYDLLTEDLSKNSTIVKHPHSDQFVTNTGYSYFLEQYENKIELGKKNILEHEYLFEGGNIRAIRFFRNKLSKLKIVSTYEVFMSSYQPAWFDGIFSEITCNILVDKLTKTEGYLVFLYEEGDLREPYEYLFVGHDENVYFYAKISKDVIDEDLRIKVEEAIDVNAWEKYIDRVPL